MSQKEQKTEIKERKEERKQIAKRQREIKTNLTCKKLLNRKQLKSHNLTTPFISIFLA